MEIAVKYKKVVLLLREYSYSYCLFYEITQTNVGTDLKYWRGKSAYTKLEEDLTSLGAQMHEAVTRSFQRDRIAIYRPHVLKSTPNAAGAAWWAFIVPTSPTRDAGYVIMAKIVATTEHDVEKCIVAVQDIMAQ